MKPRVLICDDHFLFGNGVKEILDKYGFDSTFVSTADECKKLLNSESFEIFLCDINLHDINGFDLLEEMKPRLTHTSVYILSGYHEHYLVEKARKLGLNGYIAKESKPEDFVELLIAGHKDFLDLSNLKKSGPIQIPNVKEFEPKTILLSKQEKKIIQLVAQGLSSKEIGDKLFISKNTVDTHRRNINRKLDLNSVGALITFAHENGLIA